MHKAGLRINGMEIIPQNMDKKCYRIKQIYVKDRKIRTPIIS